MLQWKNYPAEILRSDTPAILQLNSPMTCPVCNAANAATSVRCLECGTILIPEAVPRSDEMQRTADGLDRKLAMGYGGLIGSVVGAGSWFAFSRDESEVQIWLMLCSAAGALLGALIASRERNKL